jgi:hypothetical protein
VFAYIPGSKPAGLDPPAFKAFPPADDWDIDALRQGPDGYWYFRGIQRKTAQPKTLYLRTPKLTQPGEPVSLTDFRNSALPSPTKKAPPLLKSVLEEVFRQTDPKYIPLAGIIAPNFPYPRYFAPDPALPEKGPNLLELSGYYLEKPGLTKAAVILPDGRGIAGKTLRSQETLQTIALPALPAGFSYTRIGIAGETLVAAWEEQQDMSIGSTGLLFIRLTD